jgi:hypothetical protein
MFAAILTGMTSCYNTSIPKPDQLIEKEAFVKMMVDIYLIQGINTNISDPKVLKKKLTQTNLYYSVLKKYSVADTVFIRSLIYYSSYPKEYEKMHVQILNNLNEMELEFKPKEKLKVGPK